MTRFERLRQSVALGLRRIAGGPKARPDPLLRQQLRLARVAHAARLWVAAPFGGAREVVRLAWPIAVAMLGDALMGLVDTKLVGGLGAAALGGVGVAMMLMWLCYSMIYGLMRGVKVGTAHAVGEGRPQDGIRYAQAGVVLGAITGIIVWLVSRDVTWALVALRIDPSTVPYARDFLAARTAAAPVTCIFVALVQYRQGVGDTRSPMVAGLLANVFNGFLAYALIYGALGLPALGVRGAGYATAIAESLEACALYALLVRDRVAYGRRGVAPRTPLRRAVREVVGIGGPTGVQFGFESLGYTAFTAIIGGLGAAEIAAHQVSMAVIRASFLPGLAIGEAASVLVGRSLGARSLRDADRATAASIALAAGFMTTCGVFFALFGGAIARFFTDDPAVAGVARRLLAIAAVFQTLDAVTMVLRGALRSAKDVRVVALIGIAVTWTCVPGAALVLGRMAGWGAFGGWCGFIAETSFAAALFWRRWRHGAWRARYLGSGVDVGARAHEPVRESGMIATGA